jgi:hypothetical protein
LTGCSGQQLNIEKKCDISEQTETKRGRGDQGDEKGRYRQNGKLGIRWKRNGRLERRGDGTCTIESKYEGQSEGERYIVYIVCMLRKG